MHRSPTLLSRMALSLFSTTLIIASLYNLPQASAENYTANTLTVPSLAPSAVPANAHYASVTTKILSSVNAENSTMAGIGKYVFTGSSTSLSLIDESDPSRLAKRTLLPLSVRKIQLAGEQAYIGTNNDGLHILDISNPISPTVLGAFGSPAAIRDIQVVGTTVYAIASIYDSKQSKYITNLQIVDVKQPSMPHLLSSLPLQGDSALLRVALGRLYINGLYIPITGSGPGFGIVDVSDPSNPVPLSVYNYTLPSFEVVGTTVYSVVNNSLETIDTTIPATPMNLSSIPLGFNANQFHLVDNLLYISGVTSDQLSDTVSRFSIDNITPTKFDEFNLDKTTCRYEFYSAGATLSLLSCGELYVFTISRNIAPVLLGKYSAPKDVRFVRIIGNYAYLVEAVYIHHPVSCDHGGNRLWIFDITRPEAPVFVSSIDLMTIDIKTPICINVLQIDPDRIFITNSFDIKTINISNKKKPSIDGIISMPISGKIFYLENSIAYVVDYSVNNYLGSKVSLVDIHIPGTPILLGSYTFLDTHITAMRTIGNTLYVATRRDLVIIDISDPIKPIRVNIKPFTTDFEINSLKVTGQYIFLNGIYSGQEGTLSKLAIVDIHNQMNPILLSEMNGGNWDYYKVNVSPDSLVINDNLIFLNSGTSEYSWDIIDITDVTNPKVVGHYTSIGVLHTSIGTPQDAQIIGNLLYLGSEEGFQILDVHAVVCDCSTIYLPIVRQSLPVT